MTVIKQSDLIDSVADALQYISYYHPPDFIRAMADAYRREESPAAKAALEQVLVNSRLCALGKRPICQDTGIVIVFLEVGMEIFWDAEMGVEDMINEGVRRAYAFPDNVLRGSVLADPDGSRTNTRDNTPAVIHTRIVPGNRLRVEVAAKGGGSEAKAMFKMLNPSDSVQDWILQAVPKMGAGWCPPGVLGVGHRGYPGKSHAARQGSHDGAYRHSRSASARAGRPCRATALGAVREGERARYRCSGSRRAYHRIGCKVLEYPTHAANKPVAVIPNCAATRHLHFELDGTGAATFEPPDLDEWQTSPSSPATMPAA